MTALSRPYYELEIRDDLPADEPPEKDVGTIELFKDCGWEEKTPLDFAVQWNFIDYEFGVRDPSTRNFPYSPGT